MRAAETALPARMWSRWSHKNQLNLLQLRLHPLLQEPPFSTGVGALTNGLLLYVQSLGQQLFSRFACTTGSTLNIHLGRRIRVCISITLATEKRSIDALEPPKHCFFSHHGADTGTVEPFFFPSSKKLLSNLSSSCVRHSRSFQKYRGSF